LEKEIAAQERRFVSSKSVRDVAKETKGFNALEEAEKLEIDTSQTSVEDLES
jgi:hypothetical protein